MNRIRLSKKIFLLVLLMVIAISSTPMTFADMKTIPVRTTFEGIGFKVGWVSEEKAITLEKDLLFVKLYMDSPVAWINGNYEKLYKPIQVVKGVSYTDETLLALLYDESYSFVSGKVVLKPNTRPSTKYALPVVGTEEHLKTLLPNFGNTSYRDFIGVDVMPSTPDMAAAEASDQKVTEDHSTTNVQVAGIDEADTVKTDGRYIYTLRNGGMIIVDTANKGLDQVGSIKVKDVFMQEFYVKGDKLVVIGTQNSYTVQTETQTDKMRIMPYYQTETVVLIYDLTSIETPKLLKTFAVKGYVLSSRMKDNDFYMVVNQNTWYGSEIYPTLRIDQQTPEKFGPERIHYFPETQPTGMMMTFALSIDQLDVKPDAAVYLNAGETLYMSNEHLYVAQSYYPQFLVKTETEREKTMISQFTLDHGRMVFTKSGEIEGRMINQWAMDEYKGNLRVAVNTSVGYIRDESTVSRIAIYAQDLTRLGKTEDLAPGEKIYAVRFMEDLAYLVTFKQIDPFFAIDCSAPEKPVVLGYLKIPGYSQYLHPLSDTKILGLGHQTKETEFGIRNDGLKFSVFDTADLQSIKEMDTMVVGSGSASSESLYNHKAFMINLGRQLFALPVSLYGESGKEQDNFVGAYIMTYGSDFTLKVLGTVQHKSTQFMGIEPILRILYIGDMLYTVSENRISAFSIDALQPIVSTELY